MRGILFCHMSEPAMSPPQIVFSICQSLGYKQQQHDPGHYLDTGSDGDDDNNEKSDCILKTTTLFEVVICPKQCITYSVLPVAQHME